MATLASKEKVFYCTICKEERTDPVTLACYHSVCQQCLTMSQTFHKDEDNFCPVCETNAQYSDNADSLRSQLGTCIESASCTLEDLLVKSGLMYCSVCCLHNQHNKVTHQCLDCADVLCDECHTGHQSSSATYSHRVVAIEDVNSGKYVVKAKKNFPCGETNHRGRTYAYFCQSCVIPICDLCFLFQHQGHDVLTLDDAVQNCSRKLDERSQQLRKCITESTSMLERFRNLQQDISSIREATVKCIRNKTKKAVDLILEQEQAAIRKLSKACDRQLKLTSTLNSDLKQISNLSPKLLSLTNLALGPGKDVSVLVLHNDLEKCFNESKQLQDATDVFAAKLKTPVFDVRCDIPQSSVISITHSFQNPVVSPGDSKKDESMPHDKSVSPVLSTNVVCAANADDGATRKQAEGMKDIPSSNSFTSETVIAKANPHLSDTESKCLPGEKISGTPFAVVAPRFKFEQSISGFVVTDVLRSNENLFPEPSAVDGSSSGCMRDGSNICKQGNSSCFKVTASLMIVGEAGKAHLVRCASSRYPFEGPEISFSDVSSGHMDSTEVGTSVPSAIKQVVTSDTLMTEQMTSRGLKGDASGSPFTSGSVAGDSSNSGHKRLDNSKPGASIRTFDDKQNTPGNVDSKEMILPEPQNTDTHNMILAETQNTETQDMILPTLLNSENSDMILPEPQKKIDTQDMNPAESQNTETQDTILPEPQNTETQDMILAEPQNTETPDMIPAEPWNTEPPDMIQTELRNIEPPDMILPEPRNTEPRDMSQTELRNTEPPDMILPEPRNTEPPDMIQTKLRNTEPPDMILAEPWNTKPPDMILPEPRNTEPPDMGQTELRNTEPPDMILPEPQDTETQDMILAELRNTQPPDMILAEPWNTKPPDMILPEPRNTVTTDMILPEPRNTETPDMILAEPQDIETPAEPLNTGHPEMVRSGVQNWETPDMISAAPQNRKARELVPARPETRSTQDLIPARPQERKTRELVPAGPENQKTRELVLAAPRRRRTLVPIPPEPQNSKTPKESQRICCIC